MRLLGAHNQGPRQKDGFGDVHAAFAAGAIDETAGIGRGDRDRARLARPDRLGGTGDGFAAQALRTEMEGKAELVFDAQCKRLALIHLDQRACAQPIECRRRKHRLSERHIRLFGAQDQGRLGSRRPRRKDCGRAEDEAAAGGEEWNSAHNRCRLVANGKAFVTREGRILARLVHGLGKFQD
jgi:hypothetical protein